MKSTVKLKLPLGVAQALRRYAADRQVEAGAVGVDLLRQFLRGLGYWKPVETPPGGADGPMERVARIEWARNQEEMRAAEAANREEWRRLGLEAEE